MKIYFVGIGGIGMSAIAQFFLAEGHKISGSDLSPTKVTDLLEKKGIKIFFEHDAKNLPDDVGLVIYTTAVDPKNPELKKAKALNVQTISYAEALGLISQGKFTIAVSGTHGKTTTVAMIAKIMIDADMSPTIIAGSIMNEYGSNFVSGKSPDVAKQHRGSSILVNQNRGNYFLVEACEYRRSFLQLEPNILVITNIEEDHLDYYKNLEDIQDAFLTLAAKLRKDNFLICDIEGKNLQPIIDNKKIECNIIDYQTLSSVKPKLKIAGKYNEENTKAALSVAAVFGLDQDKAAHSLEDFRGTWRRLEKKGETKSGAVIFDDYAHHPTEIKNSLSSLVEMFPTKKIVIIFQPHLFSRTKTFLTDFGLSFKGAEKVIVAPIYAAREEPDPDVNHKILAKEIEKSGVSAEALDNFEEIADYIKENFDSNHIVVTMGAGDIYEVAEIILN